MLVVISIENAPESLRGELTRWFLEIRAGIFVGTITASVRELLWEKIQSNDCVSGAVLIYSYNNEQGFQLRTHGTTRRTPIDFEGITLMRYSNPG